MSGDILPDISTRLLGPQNPELAAAAIRSGDDIKMVQVSLEHAAGRMKRENARRMERCSRML